MSWESKHSASPGPNSVRWTLEKCCCNTASKAFAICVLQLAEVDAFKEVFKAALEERDSPLSGAQHLQLCAGASPNQLANS